MRKHGYNKFWKYILYDRDHVVPIMTTLIIWFGALFYLLLTLVFLYYDVLVLVALFGFIWLISMRKWYNHIKLGGYKSYKGQCIWDLVYSKRKRVF